METDQPTNGIKLMEAYENEDKPQEVKEAEEAEKKQQNLATYEEKDLIEKPETDDKELKEFNTNNLVLNWYWISLVSKVGITFSLIIKECVICIAAVALLDILSGNFESIMDAIQTIFITIGVKWLFMSTLCSHLSLGFFCLTNFSNILKEKDKPLKFLITNIIKAIIFYLISILILKVIIDDGVFGSLMKEISKVEIASETGREEVLSLMTDIKMWALRYIGNLLADYNNSLDKLVMGSLYIILFSSPKCFNKKNILYFRLLSIIPILYVIVSLVLRALNNVGIITLSLYISPMLVGTKFTIFGFFIAVLLYIKIKERKYQMFDEEKNLLPSVFAKISSKVFSIFAFIELIVGLFIPSLSAYGFGSKYLIILCAPIMILYDYKTKYEIHIRPCKKLNMGTCISVLASIILYGTVVILGFVLFAFAIHILDRYVGQLVNLIIEYFSEIIQILELFYLVKKKT